MLAALVSRRWSATSCKVGIAPETRKMWPGLTGLIWAGRKGQVGVAEVLLAGGADLEAKDLTGRTALHHAVAFKHQFRWVHR